ncbi:MAG: tail fiber domain-containing protein, partial [Acidobacteriota bacterium]
NNAQIVMGDTDSTTQGRIVYRNNDNAMAYEVADEEEMRLTADGLCIGCTALTATRNLQVSNGVATSAMTGGDTTFTIVSTREAKENFGIVQDAEILEKIAGIDVFTYDYIDGPDNRLGLIAEDFHRVFGRGSDKTLSGQEVQMALWLAVQELTAQNKALAERLEQIEAAAGE